MKVESRVAVRAERMDALLVGLVALAAGAMLSLAPVAARAADPGGAGPAAGPVASRRSAGWRCGHGGW